MTYPAAIDAFATAVDDVPPGTGTFIVASDINDVRRAVEALEAALGTNPIGLFQDVRRRLEHVKVQKVLVPNGESVVVDNGQQALFWNAFTVDPGGTLTVNPGGELHVSPWPA